MDFFLLDTNFFREATKSPGNRLLANLIPRLQQCGFQFGTGDSTAIRIGPFGLLEVLGLKPRMPHSRQFPVGRRDPKAVYKEIFEYALDHFLKLPELQGGYLRQKHDEHLPYLNAQARPLFEVCVTGILDRELDMTSIFATFLATDFFLKQPLSSEDFVAMMPVLAPLFFVDLPEHSPTSRYRLSVRMFNHIKHSLQSLPGYELEVKAQGIKNQRDLLDTDIVQEITYGFPLEGRRHRVVALTFDNANVLQRRARHHRQVGISINSKFQSDPAMIEIARAFLTHPGGVIVQSDESGAIVNLIDLRDTFASIPSA